MIDKEVLNAFVGNCGEQNLRVYLMREKAKTAKEAL
jgi:hypothetical protein